MSGRRNNPAEMTIKEQLDDICEKICSDYCKYPAIYHEYYLRDKYETEEEANQAMINEQCVYCPFMRLV